MLPPIPIIRISPPSVKDFQRFFVKANKPIVITNVVDQWAALSKWNFDYIDKTFGNVEAGVLELDNGIMVVNTSRGSKLDSMSVNEAMKAINSGKLQNGYVISSPVENFPDILRRDYTTPDYCKNAEFLRSRIFVGPVGAIAPLHHDLPENLYVMIKGVKRITVFPPFPTWRYYPNSRFSKLPNHSKVDIENPDYTRFPMLKQVQPYTVDLKAGEILFIPSFWWHHLRNIEPSISINFWWSQGWKLPIAWTAAMYKKIRRI